MGQVVTLPELREKVAARKAAGQRIAFANGHFDILHVGHLRYLQAAKAGRGRPRRGDQLRHLRGALEGPRPADRAGGGAGRAPGRPRAGRLRRGLRGRLPGSLLADLQPDVHCKGTDDGSPERVPEYETVRGYGGRTALVGDPKDHATSDVIAKIRRKSDLVSSIRKMEDLAG